MVDRSELRASAALAAYAESLAESRRVLVLGDASSGLAEHLLDRGARLVHHCDPDRARAAEAAARGERNATFTVLDDAGLALRDGAFDLVIVENLAALGDPEAVLDRVKRAVSLRGAALVATPNPEVRDPLVAEPGGAGLDYYGLYDLVAGKFDEVRMLGQTPFVGYAIVEFGADEQEPAPALDTGYLPSGAEEPDYYVALASAHPQSLEAFAIVQVPFRSVQGGGRTRELEHELSTLRAAESVQRERAASLEAELVLAREAERTRSASPVVDPELPRLRQALEQKEAWIVELEARASTADARADLAEADLEARMSEAEQQLAALRAELAAERARADALQGRVDEREARLVWLEAELAKDVVSDETPERDVARLEAQLAERAREIARLGRGLREVERTGRSLLAESLRQRERADRGVADVAPKLDRLAAMNASLEAALTAAEWQIQALEAAGAATR